MAAIGYRPEIDGLRAVAVIPVILFHLGLGWIRGGFIGVDVFFVISGFLITSIIRTELEQGTFTFRDFWARRIRRILPALIVVTACTLAVTHLFVFRPEQQAIGKQVLAALFSVANIFFLRTTGNYWGSAESPFLHAWSLSVEEQFYLLFPVTVWLVFRFRPRWLPGCIAAAVIGSLVLFLWGLQANPTATFYLLPTRVWELGTGCLLAVAVSNDHPANPRLGVFAMAGLGLVVLSYWFFDTLGAGVGLAVVGAASIIAFGQTGLCHALLSHPVMVHIGKLSYSLYLWHWPLIVLAKPLGLDWRGGTDKAVLVVVTYVLALATYHMVEKQTRRRKGVVPAILSSGMLVAAAALQMAWTPKTYDTSGYDTPRWVEYNCVPKWRPEESGALLGVDVTNPCYRHDAFDSGQGIQINCGSETPKVVFFGDSHGTMWCDAVVDVAKQMDLPIAVFAMNKAESPFFEIPTRMKGGTLNLSPDQKLKYDQMRLQALERWKPKLVIIAARWADEDIFKSGDLLSYLEVRRVPVLLLEDPPELPIPDTNLLQHLAFKGVLNTDTVSLDLQKDTDESKREIVRAIAAAHDNVKVVPTYDLFVANDRAAVVEQRVPLYLDDDHVTAQGASKISRRLRDAIVAALSPNDADVK